MLYNKVSIVWANHADCYRSDKMIDFEKWFDLDNLSPKQRSIVIKVTIVVLSILTTLAGILFSVLTM